MTRRQLLGDAELLRTKMRGIGTMLQGASVVRRRITCGKPNCRCTRGQLHTSLSVTYKLKGKTKTICIGEDMEQEVLLWAENWRRFRKLLRQHSALNLAGLKARDTKSRKRPKRGG